MEPGGQPYFEIRGVPPYIVAPAPLGAKVLQTMPDPLAAKDLFTNTAALPLNRQLPDGGLGDGGLVI